MKNKRVLFTVLALFMLLPACNQKAKKAMEYHDNLLHAVRVAVDSSLEYGDAVQSHDRGRILRAQQQYSSLIDKTIGNIRATGGFEGDNGLESSSLELLRFYRKSLDTDFIPFFNSVQSSSFNEDQSFVADSLYSTLVTEQNIYWEKLKLAEQKFYKQYGLEKMKN